MISDRISACPSEHLPGSKKNFSTGTMFSPFRPSILRLAPKAIRGVAVSAEGAALQRFPPIVAMFLICIEANASTASDKR